MRTPLILSLALLMIGAPTSARGQNGSLKPFKVIIRVEREGPEGLSVQAAKDLTALELTELDSLIRSEIRKLPNHVAVSANDPDDAIGVVVAAAKCQLGQGTLVLLSSVITIARADGSEPFVSHDVIAAESLSAAAKAVGFYLASVELRGMLGALTRAR
jgi:hypothetical protein